MSFVSPKWQNSQDISSDMSSLRISTAGGFREPPFRLRLDIFEHLASTKWFQTLKISLNSFFDFMKYILKMTILWVLTRCYSDVRSRFHICYQNTTSFYFHKICILGNIVGVSSSHQAMIISACGKPRHSTASLSQRMRTRHPSISVLYWLYRNNRTEHILQSRIIIFMSRMDDNDKSPRRKPRSKRKGRMSSSASSRNLSLSAIDFPINCSDSRGPAQCPGEVVHNYFPTFF